MVRSPLCRRRTGGADSELGRCARPHFGRTSSGPAKRNTVLYVRNRKVARDTGFMSNINPNPFTTRPEIEGTFGVVTSTHWIATAVGMAILERGGNAFDSACATAFTLQVVEPHLNGPGGDVPVILYDVRKGRPEVICGQGPAPAGATIAHYRSLGLDMMPGTGLLAACVPGMFDTWMTLLRDYGTMRLADVLAPAIFYAREGHPLVERANATIATVEQLFRDYWPTSAAVYLRGGRVPATGTLFTNPALADTYERVLRESAGAGGREQEIERARKVWSQGFVAAAIDRFCRTQDIMDTSGERHRGVLTGEDMARWQATIEPPLTYDYGRFTVCKPGVWAQGPVMLQQLALLKGFGLDGLDVTGAEFIHLVVEASKLAFADREKFYGDPEFEEVPIATLLSDAYNAERRKLIRLFGLARLAARLGRGLRRGDRAQARRRCARRGRRHGRRRADRRPVRRSARRYRAFRHRGPRRQHDFGHAVRRLAAIFAGDPGARLWAGHPRPDVLAGGESPGLAGTRQAPAHHVVADAGAARRRTLPRLGLARRRPAGPVDHPVLSAARPCRVQSPGGDRRAGLAFGTFPDFVLAAHRTARRAGGGKPGAGREPPELESRGHMVEVGPAWSEGRLTAASRDGRRRKAAANPRGMQGYAAGR